MSRVIPLIQDHKKDSLLVINVNGRIRRIYTPFRVLAIESTNTIKNGSWVYVDRIRVNEKQQLIISIDKKQRKGKTVTLVQGFIGKNEDIETLAKLLKTKCGTGGSAKDGEIIIQGDVKIKVKEILEKEKYKVKLR